MKTVPYYKNLFANSSDWFDIAAVCYQELEKSIHTEAHFIGAYFDNSTFSGAEENPNHATLKQLTREIAKIASPDFEESRPFDESREKLATILASVILEPYKNASENEATLLFCTIQGVDQAITSKNIRQRGNRGPLNSICADSVAVYLKAEANEIDGCLKGVGIKRLPENNFNSQFTNLALFKNPYTFNYPEARAKKNSPLSQRDCEKPIIRIGCCLFSRERLLDFENESCLGKFSQTEGSLFTVSYSEQHEKVFVPLVESVVENAIAKKCDLLVFPEMVMSEAMQKAIGSALKKHRGETRPKLVVAGSGHFEDNNISTMFDESGNPIGRCFKTKEYTALKHRRPDSNNESKEQLPDTRYTERILAPGKETTLFDIPSIGRVGVGICRDLTDPHSWSELVASSFQLQLLCVPACSDSIDRAFEANLTTLAKQSLTTSVVCNYCGFARVDSNELDPVASIFAPTFEKKEPTGHRRAAVIKRGIFRTDDCERCSLERGLCLRVVSIEYAHMEKDQPIETSIKIENPVFCTAQTKE